MFVFPKRPPPRVGAAGVTLLVPEFTLALVLKPPNRPPVAPAVPEERAGVALPKRPPAG